MNKPGVISDTTKTAKNLAKQAARQIAREPFEIAKTAREQVVGAPELGRKPLEEPQKPRVEEPQVLQGEKEKIKEKDLRRIQALEQEMKDIRTQKKTAEEKKREEEEAQKAAGQEEGIPTPQVSSKRSRKLFGWGKKVKEEQRRVEIPKPPSG